MSATFSLLAKNPRFRNGVVSVGAGARGWRRPRICLSVLFLIVPLVCPSLVASPALPVPRWQVIRSALSELETGGNPKAVGAKGELTEYQILPSILAAEYRSGRFPPGGHRNREVAWLITQQLLKRRVNTFVAATKRPPASWEIYALWNAPGTFAEKRYRWDLLSPVVKERCRRFAALYESHPATRRAAFPTVKLLAASNQRQSLIAVVPGRRLN